MRTLSDDVKVVMLRLTAVLAAIFLSMPAVAFAQVPADMVTVDDRSLFLDPSDVIGTTSSVMLSARSGPSGEDPTGTFSAHFGGGQGPDYAGTVTCLTVNGRQATIGVEGTRRFGPPPPQPFGGVLVVSDGGPSDAQPPWPDTLTFAEVGPPGPADCTALTPPPFVEFSARNITVVDAQTLPTSKDQCKHGGWRDFGDTFKNQGRCVAFVQRGPKPSIAMG
jgi:hypothetical protein